MYSVVAPDNASYINTHGGTPVSSNLPEVPVAAGGSVDSIIRGTPVHPNSLPEVPVTAGDSIDIINGGTSVSSNLPEVSNVITDRNTSVCHTYNLDDCALPAQPGKTPVVTEVNLPSCSYTFTDYVPILRSSVPRSIDSKRKRKVLHAVIITSSPKKVSQYRIKTMP